MQTRELVKSLYKENGKPVELTDTQVAIFDLIWKKKHPRNHIMCFTRFGKSFTVALAVLTRVATFSEKWAIVAPSEKKAKIIMSYIIEHCFDNPYTLQKLEYDKKESLERMRRERSKSRLNFVHSDKTLGEIFILSADSRTKLRSGDSLMGFGAPNVILDEAALIDDDIEAKIFRMLGDQTENFYFKIGNPFNRNHFLKDFRSTNFHKLNADYLLGLSEGRITTDFIKEAKEKPHFDILYENKFPKADAIDMQGYSSLVIEEDIDRAYLEDIDLFGELRLGVDVAGGGKNYSVIVLKGNNGAKILLRESISDTMSLVGIVLRFMAEYKVLMDNVFIDTVGIGRGAYDRLCEVKRLDNTVPNAVNFGEKASDEENFTNLRAECYWNTAEWIRNGAKLKRDSNWDELLRIKYKVQSDRKIKIMPKEEMLKQGIESPDVADALAITFARGQNTSNWRQQEQFNMNEVNFLKDNLE